MIAAIPFVMDDDLRTACATVVGLAIVESVYIVLLALAQAASVQLKRTTRSLQATLVSADLETRGLAQAQAAIRRRVGIALHGKVQGRMVADSLRIDHAAEAIERNAETDEQQRRLADALAEVSADLDQLSRDLGSIGAPQEGLGDLPAILAAIASEWRGVVAVEVHLDPPELGDHFPELVPAIAEIFRESIVNAAKHGNASAVTANLVMRSEAVHISVDDNGRSADKRVGLDLERGTSGAGLDEILGPEYPMRLYTNPRSGARLEVIIPTG